MSKIWSILNANKEDQAGKWDSHGGRMAGMRCLVIGFMAASSRRMYTKKAGAHPKARAHTSAWCHLPSHPMHTITRGTWQMLNEWMDKLGVEWILPLSWSTLFFTLLYIVYNVIISCVYYLLSASLSWKITCPRVRIFIHFIHLYIPRSYNIAWESNIQHAFIEWVNGFYEVIAWGNKVAISLP